jgi:monoamine oxidase
MWWRRWVLPASSKPRTLVPCELGDTVQLETPVQRIDHDADGVTVESRSGTVRRATNLPERERRELVLGCLTRFFGPRAATSEQYVDKVWAADPLSAGCYGGLIAPGAWMANGRALGEPVGAIQWPGSETATGWNGYMDGAIGSGEMRRGRWLRGSRASESDGGMSPFGSTWRAEVFERSI